MKKTQKTNEGSLATAKLQAKMRSILAIIALVAVIGFWVASCEDDDGGNDTIEGNTITTGAEVIYDLSIENIAEAKKATDFSFLIDWYELERDDHGTLVTKPLSYFLDGSPSVTVNDNKVTIILGTPKSAYLENVFEESITLNPSNAKFFGIDYFTTSDGKYELNCGNYDSGWLVPVYADRDVTINGIRTPDKHHEDVFSNVSLKKGWNYMIVQESTKETREYTSSTTLPSGYKWIVLESQSF